MKVSFNRFLLSVLFAAIYTNANAQLLSLKGKVFDENNAAADAVTISILKYSDSSLVRSVISDKTGEYRFLNIKPGNYLVLFSQIGYHKVFKGPFQIAADRTTIVDAVKMAVQGRTLGEVVVTDRKRYIDVRPDKTVLNVDRNILATGTSVLNVLGNAPGVKINSGGDVLLRSGQKALVMVNGKQIKLEGPDLASFLQNFQSADVEQIELIPNPSAKYDAGSAGGVVNIILKKGSNYGFNGTSTTMVGYGKFGKASKNITGNYRTNKLNIFGAAGYGYDETSHAITTDRQINDPRQSSFETRYYNTQKTPRLNYRIGADFFIDSLNTIGFLVYGSAFVSRFDRQTDTRLFRNNILDSTLSTISNLKRYTSTTEWNINYAGIIAHHQTLSADVDIATNFRRVYETLNTEQMASGFFPATAMPPLASSVLNNTAPTRNINPAFKIDYLNIISKTFRLEAGIKGSRVNTDNFQYFNVLQNNILIPYADLSSHFLYKENAGAAYVNISQTIGKFSYNAGLRFEAISSDANEVSVNQGVKRTYDNLYPSLQAIYKLKTSQLIFEYNRRPTLLNYAIVNPIVTYLDAYNYVAGNPYLQPQYTSHYQLTYFKPSVLKAYLYAEYVSNFFNFAYFTQNDATKVLTSTRTNFRSYNTKGVNIDVPAKLANWWNIDFNADVSYQRVRDYNNLIDKGTQDIVLSLDHDFAINKVFTANIHSRFESATFYGISALRPVFSTSTGISARISRVSSITFSASDIFNTDRDRYNINFANLNIMSVDKKETQVFKLTYVARFGKRSVKAQRKHSNSNEDEIKRMNAPSI